jgi:hypothetical protein
MTAREPTPDDGHESSGESTDEIDAHAWGAVTVEPEAATTSVDGLDDAVRLRVEFEGAGPGAGNGMLATALLDPADARAVARQLASRASEVEPREIEAGPEGEE